MQPVEAAREQVWDGVVEAVDETTIAAQTNARVLELPVDVGDRVARGDVLVRFSAVEQQPGQHAAANVAAARAALAAAEAALRSAGQQADYTVVRAPFDGVVTRRFVHVGQAVQSGPPAPQPLIAIAALDALRVDVVVPQSAAGEIRVARAAAILEDDGTRLPAAKVTVFP